MRKRKARQYRNWRSLKPGNLCCQSHRPSQARGMVSVLAGDGTIHERDKRRHSRRKLGNDADNKQWLLKGQE
jgi:uncharacterized cupin superfamily protein